MIFAQRTITRTDADVTPTIMAAKGVGWVPSFEDPFIWVSEEGEVMSLYRKKPILMKQSLSGSYLAVGIGESHRTKHVHRLMAETWFGPAPFKGAEVRHLDGDRFNNRLANLAWGTRAEQYEDKVRHGTLHTGERNGQAKLTRAAVEQMRAIRATGKTFKAIAAQFGVAAMTAHRAITGGSWK